MSKFKNIAIDKLNEENLLAYLNDLNSLSSNYPDFENWSTDKLANYIVEQQPDILNKIHSAYRDTFFSERPKIDLIVWAKELFLKSENSMVFKSLS